MTHEQTRVADEAVERAMEMYRGMTDTEREQVFRNLVGAVAEFGRTRDVDALTRFADAVAMTIRMRLIPGYQDRVHASQSRTSGYEVGLDVDEVLKQP